MTGIQTDNFSRDFHLSILVSSEGEDLEWKMINFRTRCHATTCTTVPQARWFAAQANAWPTDSSAMGSGTVRRARTRSSAVRSFLERRTKLPRRGRWSTQRTTILLHSQFSSESFKKLENRFMPSHWNIQSSNESVQFLESASRRNSCARVDSAWRRTPCAMDMLTVLKRKMSSTARRGRKRDRWSGTQRMMKRWTSSARLTLSPVPTSTPASPADGSVMESATAKMAVMRLANHWRENQRNVWIGNELKEKFPWWELGEVSREILTNLWEILNEFGNNYTQSRLRNSIKHEFQSDCNGADMRQQHIIDGSVISDCTSQGMFRCRTVNNADTCIFTNLTCNGIIDCPEGDDETELCIECRDKGCSHQCDDTPYG